MIIRTKVLKEGIIELLLSDQNKHFEYAAVKQTFLDRGCTLEEFTRAINGLVMENQIKADDLEIWITE